MQGQMKIGQYVLEREIGEGGMAQVWQARHVHLGTLAAVKFLLPRLAADPELEGRFLNEGKRQARLQHPNIVSAIDFVQQDGRSFLIMQFVDGESLEHKLKERQGALTLDEVHAISWDVLSALDYAHSQGIVHRDVKPSNILIDKTGTAFITDFGIALALSDGPRLTRTGAAIGTALYMSPEQILRPRAVDARTDIYSFGCVLYAMLAGIPPFGGDGETDFYIKDCHVRSAPPALVYRNPQITPLIEQVVLQCLEKDPAKRFQTCASVMKALDAAIPGKNALTPVPTTSPTVPRQRTILEAPSYPGPLQTPLRVSPTPVPTVPAAVTPTPVPVPVSGSAPRKRRGWLIAAVSVLLLAVAGASWYLYTVPRETMLRLEGSTTVGDELAPKMLVAFLQSEGAKDVEEITSSDNHRDVRARLAGEWRPVLFSIVANGSPNAFTALKDSNAEVGMASRPINDKEVQALYQAGLGNMRSATNEAIVALDGIAVIVNNNNPVSSLTRDQIGKVFRGQVTDWSSVGGNAGAIHLYGRNLKQGSGTLDTFAALVLGGDKTAFAHSLQVEDNGEKIAEAVGRDPNGVGYVGLGQIGSTKALAVSDPGTAALKPSAFSVSTEDYILSRRLFLYMPLRASDWARKFVKFAMSPEGQKVVEDVHFVKQTPTLEEHEIPGNAPPDYRNRVLGLRRMSLNFRFQPNSVELDNKALQDIDRAATLLQQSGIRSNVQILGFADSMPAPPGKPSNQQLSEDRARVVADRLRSYDINVVFAGFSSAMPVGDNGTKDGREKNRRVEVWAR